jgi:cold shock CspA family protein
MPAVAITGADLFDLAAGLGFNTLDEHGHEIIICGADFEDDDIATLVSGQSVTYQEFGESYRMTAPDEPWHGHHNQFEMTKIWAGPFAARLVMLGLVDPDLPPTVIVPGPRQRLSSFAEPGTRQRLSPLAERAHSLAAY